MLDRPGSRGRPDLSANLARMAATLEDLSRHRVLRLSDAAFADYLELTASPQARMILDNWQSRLPYFVKVMPIEYRTSLGRMRREAELQAETVSATEEGFN